MKYCPVCERSYDAEMRVCGIDGTPLKQRDGQETPGDPVARKVIRGRYQVLRKLGEGGMGTVYLAEQLSIGRRVALKVLRGNYARDDEFIARFRREARLAASLSHRNIVTVYDFDQDDDGSLFIVMEYVSGMQLTQLIRNDGPLGVVRATRLGRQIAEGLAAAHRAGVIHRDIKPDNIMVIDDCGSESVRLMDFGVARLREGGTGIQLTRAGTLLGTPAYMAPEQVEGEEVSDKTDIYALGIVLYEMLSGSVPFKASTPSAVLLKQMQEKPVPLRKLRGEVPAAIERVVMRALEKKPQTRQQSMIELAHELTLPGIGEAQNPDTPHTMAATSIVSFQQDRKRRLLLRLGVGGVCVALLGGFALMLWNFTSSTPQSEPVKLSPKITEVDPPTLPSPVNTPAPASPPPTSIPRTKPATEVPAPSPKRKSQENAQQPKKAQEPKKAPEASIAESKFQDHLRSAESFRRRGEYADARAELERAQALEPSNKEVAAEIAKVHRACEAERKILGRPDLKC
jgi:serine/threonine protein kinase